MKFWSFPRSPAAPARARFLADSVMQNLNRVPHPCESKGGDNRCCLRGASALSKTSPDGIVSESEPRLPGTLVGQAWGALEQFGVRPKKHRQDCSKRNDHSWRKAFIGSMAAALQLGIKHAASAPRNSNADTNANVTGSVAGTP